MNKFCGSCIHYDKLVTESPCFECQSTTYKKNFKSMELNRKEEYKKFANKITEYRILNRKARNGIEFMRTLSAMKRLEEELSTMFTKLICGEVKIRILEVKDGKPYIII